MLTLVFVACLAGGQGCDEVRIAPVQPVECAVFAQQVIVSWLQRHPSRVLGEGRWRCETGRRT